MIARVLGVVMLAALVGGIVVASRAQEWPQWVVVAALVGVCGFVAWWDRAVVRR